MISYFRRILGITVLEEQTSALFRGQSQTLPNVCALTERVDALEAKSNGEAHILIRNDLRTRPKGRPTAQPDYYYHQSSTIWLREIVEAFETDAPQAQASAIKSAARHLANMNSKQEE